METIVDNAIATHCIGNDDFGTNSVGKERKIVEDAGELVFGAGIVVIGRSGVA